MQNVYFGFAFTDGYVTGLSKKIKGDFKRLLAHNGYSGTVAAELWKWYDFSEKKGVASF